MVVLSNFALQENPHSMRLEEKFIHVKQEMYALAHEFGLNHELTVAKSQELDVILNRINHLQLLEHKEENAK